MTTCRPITPEDVETLVEMGERIMQESEYRGLTYSSDKIRQIAQLCMDGRMYGIVAVSHDRIVGVLVAMITEAWFSSGLVSSDLIVYVTPDSRGGFAFILMVHAYIAWAAKAGAQIIFLRTSTGVEPEKTARLYEKTGFKQVGGIFRMEV